MASCPYLKRFAYDDYYCMGLQKTISYDQYNTVCDRSYNYTDCPTYKRLSCAKVVKKLFTLAGIEYMHMLKPIVTIASYTDKKRGYDDNNCKDGVYDFINNINA